MAFRQLTNLKTTKLSTDVDTSNQQAAKVKSPGSILRRVLCGGEADEDIPNRKPDLDLTGMKIRDALEHMSQYLAERKHSIDLVAIDSTFDALWYTKWSEKSNAPARSTFNVAFLHPKLDKATYKDMHDAIEYARDITGVNLHGCWLQHQHTFVGGPDADQRVLGLVHQAKDQNASMFRRDGLTVYGAPWHFLFVNKGVKLCCRGIWASELEYKDAVFFLRQYIYSKENKIGAVREMDVVDWMDRYSLSTQGARADLDTVLADVASKYKQEYFEGGAIEQAVIDRGNRNRWTLNGIVIG